MIRRRPNPDPDSRFVNTGIILVDGDNLCALMAECNCYFDVHALYEKVTDSRIGIDEVVGAYFFRTVADPESSQPSWSDVPIAAEHRQQWSLQLFPSSKGGYPDTVILEKAVKLRRRCQTFVIVSSDGGSHDRDGGFPRMADELRNHPNPLLQREVVLIGSNQRAPRGWERRADNFEWLEDLVPVLGQRSIRLDQPTQLPA